MRGIILWSLIIIIYLKICERVVSSEADKRFRMGAKASNNRGFGVWNKPSKGRAPAMRRASTANNKKLSGGNPCHDAIPNCQQLRQKQGCRKIHSKCEKVKFLSVSSAWPHHVFVYFQSCGLCPGMTPHPSLKSPKGSQNKSLKRGTNSHPSFKTKNRKLVRGNPCHDVASNCKELRPKHGCRKIAEKCKKVRGLLMTTSCSYFVFVFSELWTVSWHDPPSFLQIPKRVQKQISKTWYKFNNTQPKKQTLRWLPR